MRRSPATRCSCGRFVPALAILSLFTLATVRGADDPDDAAAPNQAGEEAPPRDRIRMRQLEVPPGADGAVLREPYLGLVAGPVSEQLQAQLELPPGTGLAVEAVTPRGPAGRGGVRRFDILQTFNDQLIHSRDQLATLLQKAGKGAEVKLTVLRGGRPRELLVTIGERDVEVADRGGQANRPGGFPGLPPQLEGLLGNLAPPGFPGLGTDLRVQIEQQVQAGFAQAQAQVNGFATAGGINIVQGQAGGSRHVAVTDRRGTVEIRESDGARMVTIKAPSGAIEYTGPLGTAEERGRIPEAYRGMVAEVEARLDGPAGRRAAAPPAADEEI